MHSIHPVILSGGMGSRLWPLSRAQQPKQFQSIDGDGGPSFLQATALRHRGVLFHEPVVVANATQAGLIAAQLREIGCDPSIIGEPVGRNTGPAVLAAALCLVRDDPDAVMLVLPSDHVINGDLNITIALAQLGARDDGRIVTIGIVPRYPETGFGYITDAGEIEGRPGLHAVKAFVEKPQMEVAKRLVAEGNSYWAAGISVLRADVLIEEFGRLEPATLAAVRHALADGTTTGEAIMLAEQPFSTALDEPTERAIYERSPRVALAPADVDWSDVGAWPAMHGIAQKNEQGNVLSPEVLAIETHNSFVRGCGRLIAVVGMEDVIVVDTPDALLVTNHANAQLVKNAVTQLRVAGRREVDSHLRAALAPADAQGREDGVSRMTVASGRTVKVTGTGHGGSVVTVVSGQVVLKQAGQTVSIETGEIFFVGPGETSVVGNAGNGPLVLVSVDIEMPDADGRLLPNGAAVGTVTEVAPAGRRFVA